MKIHFLGIGGSGASAAAAITEAQGFEVTGCDLNPHTEFTTQFKTSQLLTGHSPEHLHCHPERSEGSLANASTSNKLRDSSLIAQNDKDKKSGKVIDILAVTPAIFSLDPNNPELLAAKENNIPIMTWQQFVGEYLTKDKFVIAVCGTHGKTTTTAMIAQMLEDAGFDPTVILGAIVPKWGTNYRIGKRRLVLSDGERSRTRVEGYFVLEADEFNDNFLPTKPDIAVVTNIEMDHPEYFKNFEAVKESFKKFLLQTKQTVVANLTDSGVAKVISSGRGTFETYLDYSKNELGITLQIPGEFNKLNAKATMQVGLLLGIKPEIIRKSLENFRGAGRRFEYIGEFNGAKVYSDFGHHPTEIKVTMEAARQKFPGSRIWLIYEPHMFSRTKALFDDFVKVFKGIPVDKIVITDIYPSREVDTGLVSPQDLIKAINSNTSMYQSKDNLLQYVKKQIQKDDIVFFMGAGDSDYLARKLAGKVNRLS